MLNGPTCEELVKDFLFRAEVYDREAAKMEELEKIKEDETMKGKTRAEMGLPEFTQVEISPAVMGIPVTITEEIVAKASRCANEGKFQWNLGEKSSWKKTVDEVFHKDRASKKKVEHGVLQKVMVDSFLQKEGGTDTVSLDHKVLMYFLVTFEKVNPTRYIFHHMI